MRPVVTYASETWTLINSDREHWAYLREELSDTSSGLFMIMAIGEDDIMVSIMDQTWLSTYKL